MVLEVVEKVVKMGGVMLISIALFVLVLVGILVINKLVAKPIKFAVKLGVSLLLIYFIFVSIFKKPETEYYKWVPITLEEISFKIGNDNKIDAAVRSKFSELTKEGGSTILSVRILDGTHTYAMIEYDRKTGIISGFPYPVPNSGYFYFGKAKNVDGILTQPVFLKGTTFYFNSKTEFGLDHPPGIEIVLPYSLNELKRITKEDIGQL